MNEKTLSVLIPARNEIFLARTVEEVLKKKRGNTEVIVGLDGAWADPPLEDHPGLVIFYVPEAIGQRAMTNQLCRLSKSKYVMKLDAHCILDEGFDVKMMDEMQDDWTMIPMMYNLHAFDWKCMQCGKRTYQGPTPTGCSECENTTNFKKKMVWRPRMNRCTWQWAFDRDLKFQYWQDRKPEGDIVDTMSLLGACFMLTREKYWELNICDEDFGSWGQQGTEVACKTWLSGGRLVCNKKTWFSHLFRTQGGDFGFPYAISGKQVSHARNLSKELFLNNKWKSKHSLKWLVEKFWPVKEWSQDDLNKLT
jgi:hypothetical protein